MSNWHPIGYMNGIAASSVKCNTSNSKRQKQTSAALRQGQQANQKFSEDVAVHLLLLEQVAICVAAGHICHLCSRNQILHALATRIADLWQANSLALAEASKRGVCRHSGSLCDHLALQATAGL